MTDLSANFMRSADNRPLSTPVYPEGVRRRLLKGMGANVLGQAIALGSRIVLVPLLLHAWGEDVYAQWLVLSAFVAHLSLSDAGGQVYITNTLTQAYARNDQERFRTVLNTALVASLMLATLLLALFVVLIWAIRPTRVVAVNGMNDSTIRVVLAFLAAYVLYAVPQGLLLGVFRAVGLTARSAMFANFRDVVQLALVVGAILGGGRPVSVAALQTFPVMLTAALVIIDLKKRFPELLNLSPQYVQMRIVRQMIRPSLDFLGIQVAYAIAIQGTMLVAGAFLRAAEVVLFSALRTMANAIKQLLGLIAHVIWPEMTRFDACKDMDKLVTVFRVLIRTSMTLGATMAIALHFFGRDIYAMWLGPSAKFDQAVMDAFLIHVLQATFWTACGNVLMAVNHHRTFAGAMLISAVVGILAAYIGAKYFGLPGLVVSAIVSDLLLPFWCVPYLLKRYHHEFSLTLLIREAAPPSLAVATAALLPWSAPVVFVLLLMRQLECLFGRGPFQHAAARG